MLLNTQYYDFIYINFNSTITCMRKAQHLHEFTGIYTHCNYRTLLLLYKSEKNDEN